MDNTIRKNEKCVIGLPRCDFVFSSTRSCFIAYGFNESPLEMGIIRKLLKDRGIQTEEAGGRLAPAQNAFCAKICSKIIISQFCIILLNNENRNGTEIPNANVNMEYGLMLGFNKYVIPFQRASQVLPFNVAGLDTVKYENNNFEQLAVPAIEQAIKETQQEQLSPSSLDQLLSAFLMSKRALVAPVDNEGEKNLYNLGSPLGFGLLIDFSGLKYIYFGYFTALRPELVIWRIKLLNDIVNGRIDSIAARVKLGTATEEHKKAAKEFISMLEIWIMVMNEVDKKAIIDALGRDFGTYALKIFTRDEMNEDLANLGYRPD